jgi:exopolysaccharide biosynthesis WecB/TagA/CpsF family protein
MSDLSGVNAELSTKFIEPEGWIVPLDSSLRAPSTVDIFGLRLTCCNCRQAAELIAKAIVHAKSAPLLLTHVNVHSLRSILPNNALWKTFQAHGQLLLEGVGLKAACLLTKWWTPADTNGTDLFPILLDRLRGVPCRLFLLGGEPNVLALAKQKIVENWSNIEIVGWKDGFFSNEELSAIREQVRRAKPTLLLIGMGSPKQEALALSFLQIPGLQLVWTVGGLFDRLSGRIARAPTPLRMLRLEWLYRILIEPRRLAFRYLCDALWLIKSCVHESFDVKADPASLDRRIDGVVGPEGLVVSIESGQTMSRRAHSNHAPAVNAKEAVGEGDRAVRCSLRSDYNL